MEWAKHIKSCIPRGHLLRSTMEGSKSCIKSKGLNDRPHGMRSCATEAVSHERILIICQVQWSGAIRIESCIPRGYLLRSTMEGSKSCIKSKGLNDRPHGMRSCATEAVSHERILVIC